MMSMLASYVGVVCLRERAETARSRLERVQFELANETSFAPSADGAKAVLGVTSGLKLPTQALDSVSTDDKIAAMTDTGGVMGRLIDQEVEKRRPPLLKAAGIKTSRWARLPGLRPR